MVIIYDNFQTEAYCECIISLHYRLVNKECRGQLDVVLNAVQLADQSLFTKNTVKGKKYNLKELQTCLQIPIC